MHTTDEAIQLRAREDVRKALEILESLSAPEAEWRPYESEHSRPGRLSGELREESIMIVDPDWNEKMMQLSIEGFAKYLPDQGALSADVWLAY